MNQALVLLLVVSAFATGMGVAVARAARRDRRPLNHRPGTRRILLPFAGTSISRRALEAAVRLARAEDATIMPTFLAQVPRRLPLDAPLPNQCLRSMPVLEAIEQLAIAQGVKVDARVGRGRSYRDALNRLLAEQPVDRIIISATADPRPGLTDADLQWLLQKVPAEILILRPAREDLRLISGDAIQGHF